jgi:uncharacterized protein (DUF433 family)
MSIQELEAQWSTLTSAEKAEAIQVFIKSLDHQSRGISKTPGVCGGEACIDGTRIPVWSLVESRQLGITEAELMDSYPHLRAVDLVNAWAYAEAHPEEIEQVIQKNTDS